MPAKYVRCKMNGVVLLDCARTKGSEWESISDEEAQKALGGMVAAKETKPKKKPAKAQAKPATAPNDDIGSAIDDLDD